MTWMFQESSPMGGATGEAYSNVLLGTGMNPASVMAREVIQNSVDAFTPDFADKVKVVFRRVVLTGDAKAKFVRALELKDEFGGRLDSLGLQQNNCLERLDDLSKPLDLLYIEDYGTHGLFGNPHSSQSHFHRLLLSLGDGSKARGNASSGGSYGYGKSVYSANSRIHTVVAYSAFARSSGKDSAYARLLGCAYFNSHVLSGKEFSGRAWFADPSLSEAERQFPFENKSAHRVAGSLGFTPRTVEQYGTSILIVDCPVELDEIRASIEEWWWPRLLEDDLDIEIWEDGNRVMPPRPRTRKELVPLIHCFEMAVAKSTPSGKHDKAGELNRLAGIQLGNFGFTVIDPSIENDGDGNGKVNCIALVRTPRMVVSYLEAGRLPLPCVGTFVATPEVDHALKMSEPPAHDKWDSKSLRLENEAEREQVKSIVNRLKVAMKKFANDGVPPPTQSEKRLDLLEKMLGSMFRPPTVPGTSQGGHPADPIEINFCVGPEIEAFGNGLQTTGVFSLHLASDAHEAATEVSVEVRCLVMEDDGPSSEDPISITLEPEPDPAISVQRTSSNRLVVSLNAESRPKFNFRSEPYDPDWTTKVFVIVKGSE